MLLIRLITENGTSIVKKQHNCDVCHKSFIVSSALKTHKRIHTGEMPCDMCSKTFTLLTDLNEHRNIHTGDKPYQCDVCTKRFATKKSVKLHQRVHSGEKPYQYEICGTRFCRISGLVVVLFIKKTFILMKSHINARSVKINLDVRLT